MLKKSFILKYGPAIILFLSACGITTHKIPLLINWHLNIIPVQIFYGLFLVSFLKILFDFRNDTPKILLHTLPAEIILMITITVTNAFRVHILNSFFTTFVNLYWLTLGFYLIYIYSLRYKKQSKNLSSKNITKRKNSTSKKNTNKNRPLALFILSLVVGMHFLFGLYHLDKSAYVDERLWTYNDTKRIEKYWVNILEKDWYNTRPSDKPGISLAFISGPSLLFTTPSDFKRENNPSLQDLMHMLFIMRLPLVIFSSIILLLFYKTVSTIINPKVGILSVIFIGLSPILLGVSRLVNPDSLSWSIIPLVLLSFFSYQKTKKIQWLYLTGILLGWGILTKYIANLLFIFFFLSVFIQNLFYKNITKETLRKNIRESLSSLAIITLISFLIFYIFFPGAWVKPERLLLGTIWSQPFEPIWKYFVTFIGFLAVDYFFYRSSIATWLTQLLRKLKTPIITLIPTMVFITILIVLYNVYFAQAPIIFENFISSPKTSIRDMGFYINAQAFIVSFYILIFGISPLALIGVIFVSFPKRKSFPFKSSYFPFIWQLFLFIIIFYLASIFSNTVPIVRYQIILYPLIFIIAAYGWYQIILLFKKNTIFHIITFLIIISSLTTLYSLRPHYFSYNSPLLPRKNIINLKDMGDGIYETAQYLNNLPNAKNLNVWSDRKIVCTLFIGKCTNVTGLKGFIKDGPNYNYYVISSGHKHRITRLIRQRLSSDNSYPLRLDKLYSEKLSPIFKIQLGNRPNQYIKIINANNKLVPK
ncbi:MAG: hypothetical protein DSY82_01720 [Flavobacteriia bacterium]|nr:MAG: hypothetical protein DSY82_01720 [Flavobacteriia bacterium]